MEVPRLNCHKGILLLLLLLQTAGGVMAQSNSQNKPQDKSQGKPQGKSQGKSQNGSHNRSQNNPGAGQGKNESPFNPAERGQNRSWGRPQTKALPLNKWTGNLELVTGLGIGHLSDDVAESDPKTHLLEQVKFNICRSTPTFFFSTQAQGFFEKNENYTRRTFMRGKDRAEILGREGKFSKPEFSLRSDFDWRPTSRLHMSAYFSYEYDYDKTENNSVSVFTDAKDLFNFKVALEDSRSHQHAVSAGWQSSHHLGSSRGNCSPLESGRDYLTIRNPNGRN